MGRLIGGFDIIKEFIIDFASFTQIRDDCTILPPWENTNQRVFPGIISKHFCHTVNSQFIRPFLIAGDFLGELLKRINVKKAEVMIHVFSYNTPVSIIRQRIKVSDTDRVYPDCKTLSIYGYADNRLLLVGIMACNKCHDNQNSE